MNSTLLIKELDKFQSTLDDFHPEDWGDIEIFLNRIKKRKPPDIIHSKVEAIQCFARGTAFITFSYGIDGVSIEISKYGHTLFNLFKEFEGSSIHLIGGNIDPQVESIMGKNVQFHQLEGIDGWDKWDEGKWFGALYRKKMRSFSDQSRRLTKEMYEQAVIIAKQLGEYFITEQISLVIPVNIASNPGNFALTLGLVLATEFLGTYVLNSNHDFYWESGKPLSKRKPGDKPGVRDHFFRNIKNRSFFSLFKMLYPWNGRRWLQVNINKRQSRRLIGKFGFPEEKVFEISTSMSDSFFETYSKKDVISIRQRMGYILSNGEKIMHPVPIDDHKSGIDLWIKNQQPIILGSRPGLSVDPKSEDLIILLQPTRIVSRKRIERNFKLIRSLFQRTRLKDEFRKNTNRQLILHITGPTPIEHQEDLEKVLYSYEKTIRVLSEGVADRIFLAFSAGNDNHSCFSEKQLEPLTIETIYRMADVVLFPSETEGRGLPIIEAAAAGIPIICSQYRPKEVFREVVGDKLPEELRIKFILFPERKFQRAFLSRVAELIIDDEIREHVILHNKNAVRARYGQEPFKIKFKQMLIHLSNLG